MTPGSKRARDSSTFACNLLCPISFAPALLQIFRALHKVTNTTDLSVVNNFDKLHISGSEREVLRRVQEALFQAQVVVVVSIQEVEFVFSVSSVAIAKSAS